MRTRPLAWPLRCPISAQPPSRLPAAHHHHSTLQTHPTPHPGASPHPLTGHDVGRVQARGHHLCVHQRAAAQHRNLLPVHHTLRLEALGAAPVVALLQLSGRLGLRWCAYGTPAHRTHTVRRKAEHGARGVGVGSKGLCEAWPKAHTHTRAHARTCSCNGGRNGRRCVQNAPKALTHCPIGDRPQLLPL